MKHAMNIIKGDPDKKMMFDQAMDVIVDDVSNKVGEMERFMEISSTFIDSIDIQNGVYEQKGLELLEKMEKEGISFIFDDKTKKLPKPQESTFELKDLDNSSQKAKIAKNDEGNNYNEMFNQ